MKHLEHELANIDQAEGMMAHRLSEQNCLKEEEKKGKKAEKEEPLVE